MTPLVPFVRRGLPRVLVAALAVPALALASGCTGTTAAKPVAPAAAAPQEALPMESGFLSDYRRLRPSEQSPSVLFYRDDANKTAYRRLSVRPVAVWRGVDAEVGEVPEDDLQSIANLLYVALEKKLSTSFELVRDPGPGVLEIEIGFTLVPSPDADVDQFTTQVPVPDLAPRSGPMADSTRRFLRDCFLEVEFREVVGPPAKGALTRTARPKKAVRAAFLDARRGDAGPRASVATWGELEALFDKWAAMLDERLVSLRDGTFKPKFTARPEPAAR